MNKCKRNFNLQTGNKNPLLRQKSISITRYDDELKIFCDNLCSLMEQYDWIGLAAPQVWYNRKVICVSQWYYKWQEWNIYDKIIMINPVVVYSSKQKEVDFEWCLSLPGVEMEVPRSKKITVSYFDVSWKKRQINATWLNARIILHEIDHIKWILFPDRAINSNPKIDINKLVNT